MARTLQQAAFARKADEVRKHLASGTPVDEPEPPHGRTALHYAAMGNDLAIVELLLAAGAKADIADAFGDVPLHFAAKHPARLPVLELLVERAPHVVNKTGGAGVTPLIYATGAKFTEGIKLLLAHGADPTVKNAAGKSALDFAPNAKIKALLTGENDGAAPKKKSPSKAKKPAAKKADSKLRATVPELPAGFSTIGTCGELELPAVVHDASGLHFVVIPGGKYLAGPGKRDREAMEALEVDDALLEAMDGSKQREVEIPPMLFARHPKLDDRSRPLECTREQAVDIAAVFARDGFRLPTEDEWEWVARTCGRTVFIGSATADDAEETCAELADDWTYDPKTAGSPLGVWGLLFGEWVGDKSGAPIAGISGAAQNYPFQDSEGLAGCLASVGARPAKGEKLAVRAVRPLSSI